MHRNFKKFFQIALAATLLFTLAACSKTQTTSQSTNVTKDTHYNALMRLPQRYENVEGTALLSVAKDITEQLALFAEKSPEGINNFYVLLNPKNPTEGILVRNTDPITEKQMSSETNGKVHATGNVKYLPDGSLNKFMSDKLGITLAQDKSGNTAWIEGETALDISEVKKADDKKTITIPVNAGTKADIKEDAPISAPEAQTQAAPLVNEEPQAAPNVQENTQAAPNAKAIPAEAPIAAPLENAPLENVEAAPTETVETAPEVNAEAAAPGENAGDIMPTAVPAN